MIREALNNQVLGTKGIILSPHRIIWVQQGWLNIIEIAIRCAFLFQRIKRHDLKWRFWQLCGTTISHRSTNQYDETSTMVDRWRANVILQRQMSQDSIFMHVWRLTLVWQEQSLNLAWRPCKTVFFEILWGSNHWQRGLSNTSLKNKHRSWSEQ